MASMIEEIKIPLTDELMRQKAMRYFKNGYTWSYNFFGSAILYDIVSIDDWVNGRPSQMTIRLIQQ